MVATMDKVHAENGITFSTYNVGLTASAACFVFLAGQKRFTSARGSFLFHEGGIQASGRLTGTALQQAAADVQLHERIFLGMLKARTHLTEGEAQSFMRRTVILDATEAKRDGIVDQIAEFSVPKGLVVATIRAVPRPATGSPTPTTTAQPG